MGSGRGWYLVWTVNPRKQGSIPLASHHFSRDTWKLNGCTQNTPSDMFDSLNGLVGREIQATR